MIHFSHIFTTIDLGPGQLKAPHVLPGGRKSSVLRAWGLGGKLQSLGVSPEVRGGSLRSG